MDVFHLSHQGAQVAHVLIQISSRLTLKVQQLFMEHSGLQKENAAGKFHKFLKAGNGT